MTGSWKVGCRRDTGLECYLKDKQNKIVVEIRRNPKEHDTDNDAREILVGDFPVFSTSCEKAVVWRECNRTYGSSVFDKSELGVC